MTLLKILANTGTNKIMKWESYFQFYDSIFAELKPRQGLTVLEIGIASGGSLDLLSKYFGPEATIVGIDIDKAVSEQKHPSNVHAHIIDQRDEKSLRTLAAQYGGFDLVIDDGCHADDAIQASLHALWPFLSDKSYYCIEDIHGTFWSDNWKFEDSIMAFVINETMALNQRGSRGVIGNSSKLPMLDKIIFEWSIIGLRKSIAANNPRVCLQAQDGKVECFNTFM